MTLSPSALERFARLLINEASSPRGRGNAFSSNALINFCYSSSWIGTAAREDPRRTRLDSVLEFRAIKGEHEWVGLGHNGDKFFPDPHRALVSSCSLSLSSITEYTSHDNHKRFLPKYTHCHARLFGQLVEFHQKISTFLSLRNLK